MRQSKLVFYFLAGSAIASLLPTASLAQVGTGEIYGKVTDDSGAVMPGVSVTVESPALIRPLNVVSQATGTYRFPSLAIGTYTVRFEISGFSRFVRQSVRIETGFNAEVNAKLKVSALQETITVAGESPVVDTRSTTLATAFTREMLENIPSARDPWVILEQTPGMVMDRQNVGGNQSGQQSSFLAHGSAVNQVWNLEGASITDMAADSSPTYYDFDSFEEIQVTTGGSDASQDTGGVTVNFVTKSGGNTFRGSARMYVTDQKFQSVNTNAALQAQGAGAGNPIQNIKDYGFEFGGPIKKNKAWFWGSYGQNDIKIGVLGFLKDPKGDPNDINNLSTDLTVLKNINLKTNYQWTNQHKSSFLYQRGDKIRNARGAGNLNPIETTTRQTGPTGMYLFNHQWFASSRLMIETKLTYVDGGFLLDFHDDALATVQPTFDIVTSLNGRSGALSNNIRPTKEARIDGTYSLPDFLGGDHSAKFGFRSRSTPYETISKTGGGAIARFRNGVPSEADIVRDGDVTRDLYEYSTYFNDSFRRGRLTANFGLRWDYQKDRAKAANITASKILPDRLPAVDFKGADSGAAFSDISPRLGLTYDLSGNGRTVVKLTAARYYGLGIYTAGSLSPTGQTTLRYPWSDLNGDRFVQANELNLNSLLTFSSNYDPNNPAAVKSAITVDPSLTNDKTDEILVGLEREISKGVGVGITYIRRHYYNYNTTFRVGLSSSQYVPVTFTAACGSASCDQPSYSATYWQLPFTIPSASVLRVYGGGDRNYNGVEFVARKRFNGRWMANGSVTWNDTIHRNDGGPDVDFQDPTNQAQQDGFQTGTSNARWVGKLSGMVQLPLGLQFSSFFNARDGFPFNRTILSPTRTGSLGTASVFVKPYASERYPTFLQVDTSLEKNIMIGKSKLTLSAAGFNVLNSNVVLSRIARQNASNANNISTILSARVFRFGVRAQF